MMELPSIRVISECFVKPKYVVDEAKKPFYLGSFELMQLSHCYLQIGLMFDKLPHKEGHSIESFLERLKEALSSALSHFYPLAGQLVTRVDEDEQSSLIFIDCNKSPRAKFIHAALDGTTVTDIVSPTEVPATIQLFFDLGRISTNFDAHTEPMLVIQITQLDEGIFLGVSVNHSVVDGASFWHFISSWSEIFQSNDIMISRPPDYRRWFPEGYGPIIRIPCKHPEEFITRYKMNDGDNPISEMIFHFSYESIASLKTKANADCGMVNKISLFQALSTVIWRSITRARCLQHHENTTCLMIANARPRVNPPLSRDYFGSFIQPVYCTVKVGELLGNSLGCAALLLHQAIEEFNDEYLRNEFIKWTKSPEFFKPRMFDPNWIVISGSSREDVYSIEFGLGKPVATRTGSNKYDGKVVARPGKEGRGSVSLQICLSPTAMSAFQQDTEFVSLLFSKQSL